jgi:uncharacterized protein (TIGR02117 family)
MKLISRCTKFLLLLIATVLLAVTILNFIPSNYQDVKNNCPDNNNITAYVISNGYHTGIVLPARNTCFNWKAELNNSCADSSWIEFGWGDKDFYMAEGSSLWLGIKAMLLPTDGVMHVVRYKGNNINRYYSADHIKKIKICEADYQSLTSYISNSFYKDTNKNIIPLGKGLYGEWSQFYEAKGTYTALFNCNNWANEALKKAKIKVPVWGSTSYSIFRMLN